MSVVEFSADSWQAASPGLSKGLANRIEALDALVQGLQSLAGSGNISGQGADAMRAYIQEVHVPIVQSLLVSLSTFQTAIGVYWNGYSQVDTGGNFRLVNDEYDAHTTRLDAGMEQLRGFANDLRTIAAGASHLVSLGGAGANEAESTADGFEKMRLIAKTQQETWTAYEASDPGFNQVKNLLAELNGIVKNVGSLTVGQGRSYTAGSFNLTLGKLGQLTGGMLDYCTQNQEVASAGWNTLFDGYVADVKAEEERKKKEEALWGMLWDGLQIVAGAVITVVGLGLTPFTGGVSLGLTVLGGSLLIGGVNSMVNHVSIATTGQELNLIGMASDAVGQWYDANITQPAMASGDKGLQLLAGVGAGVGDMVSGAAQTNVADMVTGVYTLATSEEARSQLWNQLSTMVGQVASGDTFVIGQIAANLVPLGAAGKLNKLEGLINKTDDLGSLITKTDNLGFGKPVTISTPSATTSALDWLKNQLGTGGVKVSDEFAPGTRAPDGLDGSATKPHSEGQSDVDNAPDVVEYPTGKLPEKGTPDSFGYDSDGNRLPYANHRPDYAPGQVEQVWNNTRASQIDDIEAGLDTAPPSLPGPDQLWVKDMSGDWKLVEWRPGEPRAGLWDMGHLPRAKYELLRNDYLSGKISKETFLEEYRDPDNYQVEDSLRNQSHVDE